MKTTNYINSSRRFDMGILPAKLALDNKKSGKARGANGKPRSRAQIIAIALNAKKKKKKK